LRPGVLASLRAPGARQAPAAPDAGAQTPRLEFAFASSDARLHIATHNGLDEPRAASRDVPHVSGDANGRHRPDGVRDAARRSKSFCVARCGVRARLW